LRFSSREPVEPLWGFAALYAYFWVLNWWFFFRLNAYVKDP